MCALMCVCALILYSHVSADMKNKHPKRKQEKDSGATKGKETRKVKAMKKQF